MDGETAWRVFNEGQPVSLLIRGRREDGVMVTGLEIPGNIKLLLRTPIGQPDRRMRVHLDDVELALPAR